jgi:hypothetical protein
MIYWAVNGTPTWHAETVAGPGTTFSAPSIGENSTGPSITTVGPRGMLKFYWAVNGTPTWYPEQVAPPGSVT